MKGLARYCHLKGFTEFDSIPLEVSYLMAQIVKVQRVLTDSTNWAFERINLLRNLFSPDSECKIGEALWVPVFFLLCYCQSRFRATRLQ